MTPRNLSLLRLPPYCSRLNPVENVFQFLKVHHCANLGFAMAGR